jgi:ABC-type branched-subunit amino acid transport system ATPase component
MAGVQLAGMKEQVPALRMMGLHKAFRGTVAVDHVDLTVTSGSFFGLVGPNGAGKTARAFDGGGDCYVRTPGVWRFSASMCKQTRCAQDS